MNKNGDYIDQLHEIRGLMERSSRFISLSGWSGILAGCYALIGAWFARWYYFGHLGTYMDRFNELISGPDFFSDPGFYGFFVLDAGLVVSFSLITGIILTIRRAKRKGQRIWDRVAQRMLINLAIPLVTGGVFCLLLLHHRLIGLIAPSMLLFYGLSLINASKYTIHDLKYFGLAQVLLGLVAMYFIGHGLLFWALGFGLFHILYGFYMWFKYERESANISA
ncbi:MAG: hypothetical protein H6606_07755 [Flavobacteriales bacterium]|nr:hypothetical protein [Flavobacteriales bacterium]